MADFVDKKEKLAELIEGFVEQRNIKQDVLNCVLEFKVDTDFIGKDLFTSIFNEFENHFDELTQRELKQRVLLIRSFME